MPSDALMTSSFLADASPSIFVEDAPGNGICELRPNAGAHIASASSCTDGRRLVDPVKG